mmetsp:Transcript_42030/g.83138  ORF Transcript_42030/g.83138 Transcript_42030/m.83138 type:complete len:574 (+) Transcript_42030:180-1901(+)
MPSSDDAFVAPGTVLSSAFHPSSDWSTASERMGQLEALVLDVRKRLGEIQTSTQDGMIQVHHELRLLQSNRHLSRVFSFATSTPRGPTTAGSRIGSGTPSRAQSQLISSVASDAVDQGHDAVGSDVKQNIQDLVSVVGSMLSQQAKQVEQLRSDIENDRSRLQDVEGKMQGQTLELSTVKLSLASFFKEVQRTIQEGGDGMSKEVAKSIEGVERRLSHHFRQQLECPNDAQVQLQEQATCSRQTDPVATRSQLDRVDAALRDLTAEHAAQHEALAVQVQQLEGSQLASVKDHDIASHALTELQGELRLLAERVPVPRQAQAEETNVAKTEGLHGVSAEVVALQTSLDSVRNDVLKLAQDLVEMRAEHLDADQSTKLAVQQGSMAFGQAAQTRMQELEAKIHGVQVATAGEILGLTKDLGSLRIHFAGVTQVIDKLNLTLQEQQQQQQKPLQKAFFPLFSPMPSPRDKHFSPALTPRDRQQVQLASAPDLVAFRRPRSPPPLQQQHSGISVAPLAKNATSAQHSLAIAACTALPPGRLQVVQSPRAGHGTSIPAGRVASDYVERQPIRVVGADR